MDKIQQSGYRAFVKEIKEKIYRVQYQAMKAVNQELINLNWEIGQTIVAKQDQLGWGKTVVESLSKDLQKEFPGMPGFSSQNLWRMRKFYLTYSSNEKLAPLVQEISWSHNIIIMEMCKDDLEREFYIRMTIKYGWTKNIRSFLIEMGGNFFFIGNQFRLDVEGEEFFNDLL